MSNYLTLYNPYDNSSALTIDTATKDGDGRIYDVKSATVTRQKDGAMSLKIEMLPYTDVHLIKTGCVVGVDDDYWVVRNIVTYRDTSIGITFTCDHISYTLDRLPTVEDEETGLPTVEENMDETIYEGSINDVLNDMLAEKNVTGMGFSIYMTEVSGRPVSHTTTTHRWRKRLNEIAQANGMYVYYHKFDIYIVSNYYVTAAKVIQKGVNMLRIDIETSQNDDNTHSKSVTAQSVSQDYRVMAQDTVPYAFNLNDYVIIDDDQFGINDTYNVVAISYNAYDKSRPNLTLDKAHVSLTNKRDVKVKNTLNSSDPDAALSAKMGKVLHDTQVQQQDMIEFTATTVDDHTVRITALENSSGGGGGGDFPFTVGEYSDRPTENLALLSGSVTGAYDSIAVGRNAVSATDSVVIGGSASTTTNGNQSVVVGVDAVNRQQQGITIGHSATVYATSQSGVFGSIAIGGDARAQTACVAIGKRASAYYGANAITGSVAIGHEAIAQWSYSVSLGYKASTFGQQQFAVNQNNAPNVHGGTALGAFANNTNTRQLVLGNGTSTTAKSNVFSIGLTGDVYGGTYNSTGADLAEYFEWVDGNVNSDDRRGLAVTLVGDKINIAQQGDDVIGIISATASVIGDAHDDYYRNKYAKDKYGAILYEDVTNDDGDTVRQPMINPDYDVTQTYVPRSERKEWGCVGLLGKLIVHDDGSLAVGDYADVGVDGRLTRVTHRTQFRVMRRLDDNLVMVLCK